MARCGHNDPRAPREGGRPVRASNPLVDQTGAKRWVAALARWREAGGKTGRALVEARHAPWSPRAPKAPRAAARVSSPRTSTPRKRPRRRCHPGTALPRIRTSQTVAPERGDAHPRGIRTDPERTASGARPSMSACASRHRRCARPWRAAGGKVWKCGSEATCSTLVPGRARGLSRFSVSMTLTREEESAPRRPEGGSSVAIGADVDHRARCAALD